MAKKRWQGPMSASDDQKIFQVKFKSGHGQQVPGTDADEVRAAMVKTYGEDYEIESIEEIVPKAE